VCFDGQNIGVVSVAAGNMLRIRYPIPSVGGRVSYDPVLSPDHSQIAFQSCRAGTCGIYIVPVTGRTTPQQVAAQTTGALIAWLP
jgi:Tol biopolymer transport system component